MERKIAERSTSVEWTVHEAKVIDLTAVEQLDRIGVEDLVTSASEDTGTATTDEPLVSMTDPADNGEGGDEMAPTRYQRSTGVPLRERIKIARMSG
ncbi:MAG: hypothetical protein QGM46_08065 [Actinomycetota bacterium]|nr:hypothetical protein [Actinomycetota bacterium]MDK1026330.1 hypothetical protein [Actinomycetota bacterium]MDK1097374.1 hypothetical protein [Actinomycetota bacterium]MDK1103662.1 hypothetical protein [Actinomycetota bacterium]MDK1292285.1 hypothetical protein [Actinomycetota bacterium]